jgi:hypothetical protein
MAGFGVEVGHPTIATAGSALSRTEGVAYCADGGEQFTDFIGGINFRIMLPQQVVVTRHSFQVAGVVAIPAGRGEYPLYRGRGPGVCVSTVGCGVCDSTVDVSTAVYMEIAIAVNIAVRACVVAARGTRVEGHRVAALDVQGGISRNCGTGAWATSQPPVAVASLAVLISFNAEWIALSIAVPVSTAADVAVSIQAVVAAQLSMV